MAIDMKTLESTTYGDPETKLSVKRSWLKEVHKLLVEGASYKQRYLNLRQQLDAAGIQVTTSTISPDAQKDLDAGMADVDKGMDKIFGAGGAFDKIFRQGKGKKNG